MNANIPAPDSCGADVYDELREQLSVHDDDNRRLRTRYPWRASLTVWVMDEPQRNRGVREIQVETTDISRTGFGFVYRQYIHPGAMLRTRFDVLPNAPILDGIVAYCHHIGELGHRVGVQFVNAY